MSAERTLAALIAPLEMAGGFQDGDRAAATAELAVDDDVLDGGPKPAIGGYAALVTGASATHSIAVSPRQF